jgi:hemoglobin
MTVELYWPLLVTVVAWGIAALIAAWGLKHVDPSPARPDARHRWEPVSHRKRGDRDMQSAEASPTTSMYDRLGVPNIRTAVDQFYNRVLGDPECVDYFEHLDLEGRASLKRHQALLIGQLLGGPVHYVMDDLRQAHRTFVITNDAYARIVMHLLAVLYTLHVPSDIVVHLQTKLEEARPLIVTT